nr:TGS domain-containing protein [Candidatus Cloacimonadota bacterium]
MSVIISLPDGSKKEYPGAVSALDIAKDISPRLADAALAAEINGKM